MEEGKIGEAKTRNLGPIYPGLKIKSEYRLGGRGVGRVRGVGGRRQVSETVSLTPNFS
jgi:hypothetical protein